MLLTQLKHALGKHAFTEENVIYPALRAWGDKADADKLNHDHGYVKQNLYDLEGMDNASPAFSEKVANFRTELEAHIREEEDAIFPPLHAALGKAGNAKVTAQANKEGFKLA
jgi:iron-sulfur cluster repair protein YtfE (RIC family)